MLALLCAYGLGIPAAPGGPRPRSCAAVRRTRPVSELGFQPPEPGAAVGPIFCLGGFAWLQLKIKRAEVLRDARDSAAEALRAAEVRRLGGDRSVAVEAAIDNARKAVAAYEAARAVTLVGLSMPLRVSDPTGAETRRLLEQYADQPPPPPLPPPRPPQPRGDPFDSR